MIVGKVVSAAELGVLFTMLVASRVKCATLPKVEANQTFDASTERIKMFDVKEVCSL